MRHDSRAHSSGTDVSALIAAGSLVSPSPLSFLFPAPSPLAVTVSLPPLFLYLAVAVLFLRFSATLAPSRSFLSPPVAFLHPALPPSPLSRDLSVSSSPFQRSFTLARPFLPPRRSGRAFPSPRSSANPVRENEKFSWRLVDASALDRSLLCALRVRSRGDNCWEGRSTRFVLRDVEPSSAMGRCDRGLRVLRRIRFKILFSDFLSVRKVQSIPVESNFLSIFSD